MTLAPPEVRKAKATLAAYKREQKKARPAKVEKRAADWRDKVSATPRARVSANRRRILIAAQHGLCATCREPLPAKCAEVDHIVPLELGGRHDEENFQVLCIPCHKTKTKSDVRSIAKARRLRKKSSGGRKPSRMRSRGFS